MLEWHQVRSAPIHGRKKERSGQMPNDGRVVLTEINCDFGISPLMVGSPMSAVERGIEV